MDKFRRGNSTLKTREHRKEINFRKPNEGGTSSDPCKDTNIFAEGFGNLTFYEGDAPFRWNRENGTWENVK